MNSKRVNYIMMGVVALLGLLVVGTTVLGDSLLRAESDKLVEVKLENQVLEAEQQALTLAKNDLEKYTELHDIAKQIVPSDKDQAKTVREIVKIADQAGVGIASISFPASNLGTVKKPVVTPSEDGEEKPAAAPTPNITQATPAKGIPGLLQLDINITSDTARPATYEQLIDFLERLENNRRTSHVTSLNIQPAQGNNSQITFVLTVTVYIKP